MLIKSNVITTGIGFDTGNGITHFIIKPNSILPQNNTEKFIIDDINISNIKILEGVNELSQNNVLLHKLIVKQNRLYFLNINVVNNNFIFLCLYDKSYKQNKNVINIKNINNYINEKHININKLKIIYLYSITKNLIIKKLQKNNLLPKKIYLNIIKKLEIDINIMEIQQIMEKIILLKEKFLL